MVLALGTACCVYWVPPDNYLPDLLRIRSDQQHYPIFYLHEGPLGSTQFRKEQAPICWLRAHSQSVALRDTSWT
jgi:hypothetical protein